MIRLLAILLVCAAPLRAMTVQEITTESGITAWLVEEHSIPIVSMDILFRGGASIDLPDKHGATHLMMGLLEEGAGDMDATAYAEAVEALAARFSFDASRDTVSVEATVLREHLGDSMALLRMALVEPNFDQVAFDRVRGQVDSLLRYNARDPGDIAVGQLFSDAFPDHPYGRTVEGTVESIALLTPEDMHIARERALVRSRVFVGVVGDITAEELMILLDNLLGDLPTEGPDLPENVVTQAEPGIRVIDFPSPQSNAYLAHESIPRDHPDYISLYILNHIFGSGYVSRLNQEVREKRGLTYGVGSFLVPFQNASLHIASVASENAKMAEALDVIKAEWERISTEGVTTEELEAAKRYLMGSYALRFDSNQAIASGLAGLQFGGLPIDYINIRNDLVEAVTLDDINRVAREHLHPDRLQIVVVGQPDGLTSE